MQEGAASTMRRVFLVTAGTSIKGNLRRIEQAIGQRAGTIRAELGDAIDYLDGGRNEMPSGLFPLTDEERAALADAFDRNAATETPPDRTLSAELSSLYADGAPHPTAGDKVILIGSDTDEGERSARLVACYLLNQMGEPDAEPPPTVPTGDDTEVAVTDVAREHAVAVVRVRGLIADKHLHLQDAFHDLANVVLAVVDVTKEQHAALIVHPTGGFKATLPVLITLLGLLPETYGDVPVEMWTNHERTPAGIHLPLLRVGNDMRAVIRADLERITSSKGLEPALASGTAWRGVLWQPTESGVALTRFGEAVKALLG